MPTFEHTIEIEAPVEHVFAFSTDPSNWPKTNPSLSDLEIVEEIDDTTRMTATYKMLGISVDSEMEQTIVEPDAHTVSTFESDEMTGDMHWHFAETGSGTEVTVRADYEFGDSLLSRILKPVARRYNERQFRQTLQNTKDLVEAERKADAAVEA